MPDKVGQQIGNYRLIQLLGSGGFADVYLGQHVHVQRLQAAVKVLHANLPSAYQGRFLQEAETIAGLKHPHIIRVLEFGMERNIPFLVIDYAPNGTLRQRHPKGSRLSLETIMSYVKQVTEALQYAHEKKLANFSVKRHRA
jgi:serine/threonine protein kinase